MSIRMCSLNGDTEYGHFIHPALLYFLLLQAAGSTRGSSSSRSAQTSLSSATYSLTLPGGLQRDFQSIPKIQSFYPLPDFPHGLLVRRAQSILLWGVQEASKTDATLPQYNIQFFENFMSSWPVSSTNEYLLDGVDGHQWISMLSHHILLKLF